MLLVRRAAPGVPAYDSDSEWWNGAAAPDSATLPRADDTARSSPDDGVAMPVDAADNAVDAPCASPVPLASCVRGRRAGCGTVKSCA